MNQQIKSGNWPNLCEKLNAQLCNLGYNDSTLRNYRSAQKRIDAFMKTRNYTDYSEEVGKRFFDEWVEKAKPIPASRRFIKTVIRRLGDILIEKEYIGRRSTVEKLWPDCFSEQANKYIDYLWKCGNNESSIRIRKDYCIEFLNFLADSSVYNLSDISAIHIYNGFSQSNAKSHFSATVNSFLKFIYQYGYHNNDLSIFVPKPRRAQPMPTVYSEKEIQELFLAIDTSTTIGKRDYAILALASLLGLRRSDIGDLTLGNIDFRSKMIRIVQHKTKISMEIEMLPDVEDALLSYLKDRKPLNNSEKIFIRERAPHRPLTYNSICGIAQKRFYAAGIDIAGKKHGTHALRMSLATQLISEDVPYSVIQKILGQTDPNSTKHYARIDVQNLRSCALDVPPPSGLFAEHLTLGRGSGK
jgi:site-specific recombinase XerD